MTLHQPTDAERKLMAGFGKVATAIADEARAKIAAGEIDPKPRGRPTVYTRQIADAILWRLAEGEYLKVICRDEGMPSSSTVHGWKIDDRDGFSDRYARACEIGAFNGADRMGEVADGTNLAPGEVYDAAKVRNQLSYGMWRLSKLFPRLFGERLNLDHAVTAGREGASSDDLAKQLAAADREIAAAVRSAEALDADRGPASDPGGDMASGGGA